MGYVRLTPAGRPTILPHKMRTHRRRRTRTLTWLLGIILISSIGVLTLLVRENAAAAMAVAPLYTAAPDAGLHAEPTQPVVISAGPGATPVPRPNDTLWRWLSPLEFAPDPRAPEAPLANTSVPALTIRLYLPLTLLHYAAPPRQPEAFMALAAPATADWPAEAGALSGSRLGLHALGPRDPYIFELIRRARPRLVKSVSDFGWLAEVKQISPDTVTVGRLYGQDESGVLVLDPQTAAAQYIQERLEQYQLNPAVDYWEGWNEYVFNSADQLRWYAEFEAARACQMQALGFQAAVGGFAVGWPNTYPEMALFLPALEAAHRCGGIFHLHEYNKPLMSCGVRTNEAGIIPGAPALKVPAGPLTFRYRFWYEGYLNARGLGDLPLVLSEYGIDALPAINCPDPDPYNGKTWKDYAGWWQTQGLGIDGPNAYVNQLAWADREMRQDAYVLGAAVFTAGAQDGQWNPYDLHDVLVPLAHYLTSQP